MGSRYGNSAKARLNPIESEPLEIGIEFPLVRARENVLLI
jgi:hypothetical protein